MTKKEYMRKLKQLLPNAEQKDILLDYEEHFLTGMAEGKSEEQIAKELGSPEEVASEYTKIPKPRSSSNIIFGIIGILLFDLFIGISIIASIFSAWISLWAGVISILVSAVALIIGGAFITMLQPLPWFVALFAGISLLGLAALLGIGMVYVTKWLFKGLMWFVNLHVKIFTNR